MALLPEQKLIGKAFDYEPLTEEEGQAPADISLCFHDIEDRDGWPFLLWCGEWYPVPTLEEVEEWVFDSVCFAPNEDEVEPDHPDSWLSILGLI